MCEQYRREKTSVSMRDWWGDLEWIQNEIAQPATAISQNNARSRVMARHMSDMCVIRRVYDVRCRQWMEGSTTNSSRIYADKKKHLTDNITVEMRKSFALQYAMEVYENKIALSPFFS